MDNAHEAQAATPALADCQSQPDSRQLRIDKVGVKGLLHPIEVRDKHHETQDTVARISLLVDLPKDFKGTHMSRFVEVLNAHGRLVHVENLPTMLHELQKKLHAQVAHIEMEFPYFMEKEAPVTKAKGLVDYQVKFDAAAHGKDVTFTVTVTMPVTTLCPCSKAISAYGAHNQRGYVTLALRSVQRDLDRGHDRAGGGIGQQRNLFAAQAARRKIRDRKGLRQSGLRRGPRAQRRACAATGIPTSPGTRSRRKTWRASTTIPPTPASRSRACSRKSLSS